MNLFHVYLACLVFGGVLMISTIFLGGDDADADTDTDLDGLQTEADGDVSGDAEGLGSLLLILSLRFWIFFLTCFGLVGVLLFALGSEKHITILIVALITGLFSGFAASYVGRWLRRTQVGEVTGLQIDGMQAEVLIDFESGKQGKIRVFVEGQILDIMAIAFDEGSNFKKGDVVLVVEMEEQIAKVTSHPSPSST